MVTHDPGGGCIPSHPHPVQAKQLCSNVVTYEKTEKMETGFQKKDLCSSSLIRIE